MDTAKQERFWYDTAEDSIGAAIQNSGKTFKEVAHQLWPSLKMDSAYARLKNALNPDKDEKLTFAEIILICRVCGRFDPLYFMCDELSHHRPALKAPDDEQAELLHQIQGTQQSLVRMFQRFERQQALRGAAA